jgi:hypothetical protein
MNVVHMLYSMKKIGKILILISVISCTSFQTKLSGDDYFELLNYLLTDTVNIKLVTDGYKVISDKEFLSPPCFNGKEKNTIELLSKVLSEKDTTFIRSQLKKSMSFRTDSLAKFGFVVYKASVYIENKYSIDSLFQSVHENYGPGLLMVSMPIFNKGKTKAYFRYGYLCGSLCGSGVDVLLEKRNKNWFISKTICAWVS